MQFVQPFIDLLSQIVEKFGTKFAIAALGVGFLGYLELNTPPDTNLTLRIVRICGIVILGVAYFVARRKQESEVIQTKATLTKENTPS